MQENQIKFHTCFELFPLGTDEDMASYCGALRKPKNAEKERNLIENSIPKSTRVDSFCAEDKLIFISHGDCLYSYWLRLKHHWVNRLMGLWIINNFSKEFKNTYLYSCLRLLIQLRVWPAGNLASIQHLLKSQLLLSGVSVDKIL